MVDYCPLCECSNGHSLSCPTIGIIGKTIDHEEKKMNVDYRKSALVYMMGLKSGNIEFVLQVYGVWASELMNVPHPIAQALARKYPNHIATPFMIQNGLTQPKSFPQIERSDIEGLF